MTPLTFFLWLGLAFVMGAWAYRLLESQVHHGRALRTGVVCAICEKPTLSVQKCTRCKNHTCIDCRWDLLTPEPRDEIRPRVRRVVCVKCATAEEEGSFK